MDNTKVHDPHHGPASKVFMRADSMIDAFGLGDLAGFAKSTRRIIFSSGQNDPWSAQSITKTLSADLPAVVISLGAHHSDLGGPMNPVPDPKTDTQSLNDAREFEILTLADLNAVLDLCPADRMPIKWVRIFFAMIRKVRSDAREAELAKSGGKLKSSATFGAIISDEITHAHAVADHYSKGMSHDKISQRLASERATNRTTVLDLPSDAGRGTQKGGDGGGEKRAPRVIAVRPNSASGLRPDFGAASSMPSSRQVAPILECPAADAGSRAPRRHSNVVTPGHPPRRTSNVVAFGRKSIRLPEMGARDAYSDDRAPPRDARPRGDSPPPRRTNWSTVNRERTAARKLWRALA